MRRAVALSFPTAVTNQSFAMSRAGEMMIRFVKLLPAAENPPTALPAPKIGPWAFPVALFPKAEFFNVEWTYRIKAIVFRTAKINVLS